MKFLLLTSNLNAIGGIQSYNRKLIAAFRSEGEEVAICELLDKGIVSKLRFVASFILRSLVMVPDVTVVTNINFAPLAYIADVLFRRPYTVTIYGIEVAPIRTPLQRRALARAILIVKLFNQAERDVVRQIPEAQGKIFSIPNSVDSQRFHIFAKKPKELTERFGLQDALVVLTICRLSASERDNKGYAKTAEAFSKVVEKIPRARFLLVGDGDDREEMISLVKRLGLEGKVILPGAAKDEEMAAYYNLADVFVYPSKREGFPAIVLLEALACGTPVVSGNQPDAVGSLFEGEVGLAVDPDDTEALASAIMAILEKRAPALVGDKKKLRDEVLAQYGPEAYRTHVRAFISRIKKELAITP
jgi:glycosyltransferase involved in cell wall biosynthesis